MQKMPAMQQANTPYTGFLYAGLMISPAGVPNVLEFNCRLGDPETQPILMRLDADLVALCLAATTQTLPSQTIHWRNQSALTVVMAAGGYPFQYQKGNVIHGLSSIHSLDVKVFHSGTAQQENNIVTQGGRVLSITALGDTLKEAHDQAYAAIENIHWDNAFYRHDIGASVMMTLHK